MPRWCFALCGALSCAAFAANWAQAMAERCRTLRALERMLARIEGALPVYGELCLLLEHAAAGEEGEAAAFMRLCAQAMREQPRLSLQEAARRYRMPSLARADWETLQPLLNGLGACNEPQALALLHACRSALETQRAAAETTWKKDRRLAGSLGGIGAATVFLFLL